MFAILLLDRNGGVWLHLLSGLFLGVAVGTRPNLLVLAIMIILIPFFLKRENRRLKSSLLAVGVIVAILPITITNYRASGKFVFLTTSAGHNFYIGHNPTSTAGYRLPSNLDGDIFLNMKKLAERVEGHTFEDSEVSTYYFKKAFNHMINNPVKELRNTGRKIMAAINDYEATTYANYYFQKELSPVLACSISFGFLFPFAALGIVIHYKRFLLLLPVVVSFITIGLFFYIARLRMPMVPFLAIFAGGGMSTLLFSFKSQKWKKIMGGFMFMVGVFIISNWNLVEIDTSNEWNKVGVIFRIQKRYNDAERAFIRAKQENPLNPNTYLNLSVLYDKAGHSKKAGEMRVIAHRLTNSDIDKQFINNIRKN